jgi:hypothetical protein
VIATGPAVHLTHIELGPAQRPSGEGDEFSVGRERRIDLEARVERELHPSTEPNLRGRAGEGEREYPRKREERCGRYP